MFVEHVETIAEKKLEPSLKNLAYLLRHKKMWPKGFSWYYPNTAHCAEGLACQYWGNEEYRKIVNHNVENYFDIFHSSGGAIRLFGKTITYPKPMKWVTRLDIARKIEAII